MTAYSGLPVGAFPKELGGIEICVDPQEICLYRKGDDLRAYPC